MILDELRHPIVQAPMAGGASTPELVAAVSGAGGLGFLAAGYRIPRDVRDQIHAVRELTDKPFGVNIFVPDTSTVDGPALAGYRDRLAREARRYGVTLGEAVDDEITVEVKKLLNEAMKRAEESPLPDAADLDTGVYADPEELDTPHHR